MDRDEEARYIQENRPVVESLLTRLNRRRLFRTREIEEDYEACRISTHELREVLESEALAVRGRDFLYDALLRLQDVCTNFVSAAGENSVHFSQDFGLFQRELRILRREFGRELRPLVERFDVVPTSQVQQLIDFAVYEPEEGNY